MGYMKDSLPLWSPYRFKRALFQSLMVGMASTAGLLGGVVPDLSAQAPELTFSSVAYAQTAITPAEVQNYARSVLAIEPIRQTAYDEIKRISGSREVPAIACHRPSSLDRLGRDIRQIVVNYCSQSIEIVESNNLTIGRFNTITSNLGSDSALASRIQEALIRLQQASGSN